MKNFFYKIMLIIVILLMFPMVITLFFQKNMELFDSPTMETESTKKLWDEDELIGILANEVESESATEAIKAQAVIARTNYRRAVTCGEDLPKSVTREEMIKQWEKRGLVKHIIYYNSVLKILQGRSFIIMEHTSRRNIIG